jgi:hypothetical protein
MASQLRFWPGTNFLAPEISFQSPNLALQGKWAVYSMGNSGPRITQLTDAQMAADTTWVALYTVNEGLSEAINDAVEANVSGGVYSDYWE